MRWEIRNYGGIMRNYGDSIPITSKIHFTYSNVRFLSIIFVR